MILHFLFLVIISIIPICIKANECQLAPAGNDVVVLDRVDNAQTVQSLILHVENAINTYLNDHAAVRTSKTRTILWNESPDDKIFERYFSQQFTLIKYDETYRDFQYKEFDYTRQTVGANADTWDKFVFVRVNEHVITLFISYTMDPHTLFSCRLQLDEFLVLALSRMFNKIFSSNKSVFNHGLSLPTGNNTVEYLVVYHDNKEGFVERIVTSFADGTKEQERIDRKLLSSCILMIENGEKSVRSIRHPIISGYVVPDFHSHYSIPLDTSHSKFHDGS